MIYRYGVLYFVEYVNPHIDNPGNFTPESLRAQNRPLRCLISYPRGTPQAGWPGDERAPDRSAPETRKTLFGTQIARLPGRLVPHAASTAEGAINGCPTPVN